MKLCIINADCFRGNWYRFIWIIGLTTIISISSIIEVKATGLKTAINFTTIKNDIFAKFKGAKIDTEYGTFEKMDLILKNNRKLPNKYSSPTINTDILQFRLSRPVTHGTVRIIKSPGDKLFIKKLSHTSFQQDSVILEGKVTNENNDGMAGATVKIKYSSKSTFTNSKGIFRLQVPKEEFILQVSYIGYSIQEALVNGNSNKTITIKLLPTTGILSEVQVVSNGYQDIAKERATGSFEVISAKQLEHSSDPNLLRRLEGITTSINFNNNSIYKQTVAGNRTSITLSNIHRSPLADITIRGLNTLNPSTASLNNSGFPLLVIDGIPSAYSIEQINPEDVESITILKDAASASIWGSRAANGVLVIKTKKGTYQKSPEVSISSNINITGKPDLFYRPKMSISDFIDAQREQFIRENTVLTDPTLAASQPVQSPVAEILNDYLNKKILTKEQADTKINELKRYDVRNDISKYLLRSAINQTYNVGVAGGAQKSTYRLALGYTDLHENTVGANSNRLNLSYSGSLNLLKNLEINWNATAIKQNLRFQNDRTFVGTDYFQFNPYDRLADDLGNPLQLYKYRPSFINLLSNTYGSRILDMTYKPLEEMNLGHIRSKMLGLNLLINTIYKLNKALSANVTYSYNRQNTNDESFISRNSYYLRQLVNQYTDPITLAQVYPYGDLLLPSTLRKYNGQTLRGQLNFNHTWANKHSVSTIIGMDISENYVYQNTASYLGYYPETLRFNNILNLTGSFPFLYEVGGLTSGQIPYTSNMSDNRNRALSSYLNAAYTYNNKYTVSASVRRDGSNLFGTEQNRTGTPFYSSGFSWNIANEGFYSFDLIPRLQLRTTFGYNGNTNAAAFPNPRITYSNSLAVSGLPFGGVPLASDGTNEQLRPEKTGVFNVGLDFGFKGGRLTGSLEYYTKKTTDLISQNLLDPSTGFSQLSYNTGDLKGKGADIIINSQNLRAGLFSWSSNVLLSSSKVKVSKLYVAGGVNASRLITAVGTDGYNVGYDLSRMFSYEWAGLDPQTGNPRLKYNNQILTIGDNQEGVDNGNLLLNAPTAVAKYIGSAVPQVFGSIRNTFNYGQWMLSLNILYKFKYFIRRPQPDLAYYTTLYGSSQRLIGAEYSKRWKNPGDELITNVPSVTYPGNAFKDYMYYYSDINVVKGDHIRLQEINLSWAIKRPLWGFKNIRLFSNVTNLGIIWRANDAGLDPDIYDIPNAKTISFGFNCNF
jgi:TonB-linked SusC/RagA family outer membrane protein